MWIERRTNNETDGNRKSEKSSWQSLGRTQMHKEEAAEEYPDRYQQLIDHLVEEQNFLG